jgi:colanic acid biosynthesis glycosyl transferase WcaI
VIWRILRTRPDVVMCIEPTLFSAPSAFLAARLVGARSVLHVQDLEVDAAFEVGHLSGARIRNLALLLERWVLRHFDLVVTISQKMREALVRKGAPADRTSVLRNWVDLDAIRPLPRDAPNAFRRELGLPDDSFVTLYSGHLGKKQALDVVSEAASLCVNHPRLHFVIVGDGPMKAGLIARHSASRNVTFLPLQPAERFNDLLNLANLHVLPQAKRTGDLVFPSKLGAMLASGRPLVATLEPDSELARLLEGVALLVPPDRPAALAETIIAASSQDLGLLTQRGLRLAALLSGKHILPNFEALLLGAAPATPSAIESNFDPVIAG